MFACRGQSLRAGPSGPHAARVRAARVFAALVTCAGLGVPTGIAMAADAPARPDPAAPRVAQAGGKHSPNKRSQPQTINVSPAEAARAARRDYGGRILSVVLVTGAETPYYRVRLLSDGQLRVVHVKAHE